MTRIRRRLQADGGFSLVELLVSIGLISVLGMLIMTAMIGTERSLRSTSDEAEGLADVRPVAERLARDIRDAREVDSSATSSQLTLWIDLDSDYIHEASENVRWHLEAIPGDTGHFRVVRTVGTAASVVQAETLVSQIAFTYDLVAPDTRLVSVEMQYDAKIGNATSVRRVTFKTRLRNVA